MATPPPQYGISYGGTPLWRRGCLFVLIVVGAIVYASWGHGSGSQSQSGPSASATATATAVPGQCLPAGTLPARPAAELAGITWQFDISDIHSIQMTVVVPRALAVTPPLDLELYSGTIDGTPEVFGLRSDGTVYLTEEGAVSAAVAAPAPGSVVSVASVPSAVTLSRALGAPASGTYLVTLSRGAPHAGGDEVDLSVTPPTGTPVNVGTMLFTRAVTSTPVSFSDGGTSVLRNPANDGAGLAVAGPVWSVEVSAVANGSRLPNGAQAVYYRMPNSDVTVQQPGGFVVITGGGVTPRCQPAGPLWSNFDSASGGLPSLPTL